jgi:phosphatidylcholine synthase
MLGCGSPMIQPPGTQPSANRLRQAAAWAVHAYTASGAALALVAVDAGSRRDFRSALLWLFAAVIVDSTDGALARLADVNRWTPAIAGSHLDDIVDYATYVFAPAVMFWQSGLVAGPIGGAAVAAMLVASALRFAHAAAKTADHFFTGFPSYWNVALFYLSVARLGAPASAAVLLVLAVLVFAPVRFIYPTRTRPLRPLTLTLASLWGGLLLWMISRMPDVPPAAIGVSLAFPVYYVAASLWLDGRRPAGAAGRAGRPGG